MLGLVGGNRLDVGADVARVASRGEVAGREVGQGLRVEGRLEVLKDESKVEDLRRLRKKLVSAVVASVTNSQDGLTSASVRAGAAACRFSTAAPLVETARAAKTAEMSAARMLTGCCLLLVRVDKRVVVP